MEIKLQKRYKYAGDILEALIEKAGFPLDVAGEFLNSIKDAEVIEHMRGEWIPVPSSDMATGKAYKCSNCKRMRYGARLPPYCQECGAKMEGW